MQSSEKGTLCSKSWICFFGNILLEKALLMVMKTFILIRCLWNLFSGKMMTGNFLEVLMYSLWLVCFFCFVQYLLLLLLLDLGRWGKLASKSLFCFSFSLSRTFLKLLLVWCWQIGAAFLLVLLLIVLAIGVIHQWASSNFYLTRVQMFFVCFLAFLLALAALLVGWFEGEKAFPWLFNLWLTILVAPNIISSLFCCMSDKPLVGASVGYFSFLFLLAGRALTVS